MVIEVFAQLVFSRNHLATVSFSHLLKEAFAASFRAHKAAHLPALRAHDPRPLRGASPPHPVWAEIHSISWLPIQGRDRSEEHHSTCRRFWRGRGVETGRPPSMQASHYPLAYRWGREQRQKTEPTLTTIGGLNLPYTSGC
jgi:hypothetical protein